MPTIHSQLPVKPCLNIDMAEYCLENTKPLKLFDVSALSGSQKAISMGSLNMSKIELANASNAIAVYSRPDMLKEKITGWIQDPDKYSCDAQTQLSFAKSINLCTLTAVGDIATHIKYSNKRKQDFLNANS